MAKGPSVVAESKKIIIANPALKVEDICLQLREHHGIENPSASTVSTVRADLLQTLTILKEMGGLNIEMVQAPEKKTPKPKQLSRPEQWSDAISRGQDAISDLRSLQEEYQEWLDNLPENMQESETANKLQEVVDLAFEDAETNFDEADGIDLPRGFGRD